MHTAFCTRTYSMPTLTGFARLVLHVRWLRRRVGTGCITEPDYQAHESVLYREPGVECPVSGGGRNSKKPESNVNEPFSKVSWL